MDVTVSIGVLAAILILLWILDTLMRARTLFPGPKGLPFFGVTLQVGFIPLRDIYPWIEGFFEKYGSIVQIYTAKESAFLLADPMDVEVLLSSMNYIKKANSYFMLQPWLREGLLLSDGSKWHYRRKLLTPTFHFKILEDSISRQAEHAKRFVQKLLETNGEATEIDDIVKTTTLNVICETAMGMDADSENQEKQAYISAVNGITVESSKRYLTIWLYLDFIFRLSSLGRSYFRNLWTINNFIKKIILDRKNEYYLRRNLEVNESGKKRFAFLDSLLELDAQNPGALSLSDIQEEVNTFTFEGHDTTGASLLFTLFLLANHQDVQEKTAEEQFRIFGADRRRQPSMKDLSAMTYLEMVIKESLRLYPSVPTIGRRLTKNLHLRNGKVIPAGSDVQVCIWLIHRNKDYWDEPHEFRPERFSSGTLKHPFCFIPFSGGPRNCIGQRFAMMEMKIVLSTVLRNCKLEPVTKSVQLTANMILSTENPIQVKVLQRNPL